MPTIKLDRLKKMMDEIKKDGHTSEISTDELHKYIGVHFGLGVGTRKNINKLLADWNFIKEKKLGIWLILNSDKK